MDYKDYYKILGVERNADEKEIKKAYRKLARELHPDVRPNDKESAARFKEINEAYEVLGDPEKRKKYDQLGASWERYQQTGGGQGGFDWSQWASQGGPGVPRTSNVEELREMFGDSVEFSDFFSQLFGGLGGAPGRAAGRAAGPRRGRDQEQEVPITLEEAFHGTVRVIEKNGQRLEIKIPAGADTGTRVRVTGAGGAGTAGAGDLYLRVAVEPDARFERQGDDLTGKLTVDLYTAVLGGEVRVPTLAGSLMVRVPAGAQSGSSIRLRGQGLPRLKAPAEHGDLLLKLHVELPRQLSARERALFEELRALPRG